MLLHQIFIWLFLLYFSTLRGNYFSLKPCFTCSCEIISKLTADVCLRHCIVSCKESLWCLFFIVYSWIPCKKKKKKLLKWHFISELLDCMLICFHLTYLLFLLFSKLVWILIFLWITASVSKGRCLHGAQAAGSVSPPPALTTTSCCAGCCLLMIWIMRMLFITTVSSV